MPRKRANRAGDVGRPEAADNGLPPFREVARPPFRSWKEDWESFRAHHGAWYDRHGTGPVYFLDESVVNVLAKSASGGAGRRRARPALVAPGDAAEHALRRLCQGFGAGAVGVWEGSPVCYWLLSPPGLITAPDDLEWAAADADVRIEYGVDGQPFIVNPAAAAAGGFEGARVEIVGGQVEISRPPDAVGPPRSRTPADRDTPFRRVAGRRLSESRRQLDRDRHHLLGWVGALTLSENYRRERDALQDRWCALTDRPRFPLAAHVHDQLPDLVLPGAVPANDRLPDEVTQFLDSMGAFLRKWSLKELVTRDLPLPQRPGMDVPVSQARRLLGPTQSVSYTPPS